MPVTVEGGKQHHGGGGIVPVIGGYPPSILSGIMLTTSSCSSSSSTRSTTMVVIPFLIMAAMMPTAMMIGVNATRVPSTVTAATTNSYGDVFATDSNAADAKVAGTGMMIAKPPMSKWLHPFRAASAGSCYGPCDGPSDCTDPGCPNCHFGSKTCRGMDTCRLTPCSSNADCTDNSVPQPYQNCAACVPTMLGSKICGAQCGNPCNGDYECVMADCPLCIAGTCAGTFAGAGCGQFCDAGTPCGSSCRQCENNICVSPCGGSCGDGFCSSACPTCESTPTGTFCMLGFTTTTTTTPVPTTTTTTTTTTTPVPTTTTTTTTTTTPVPTTTTTTTTPVPTTTTTTTPTPTTTTTTTPVPTTTTTTTPTPTTTTTTTPVPTTTTTTTTTTPAPTTTTTPTPTTTTTTTPVPTTTTTTTTPVPTTTTTTTTTPPVPTTTTTTPTPTTTTTTTTPVPTTTTTTTTPAPTTTTTPVPTTTTTTTTPTPTTTTTTTTPVPTTTTTTPAPTTTTTTTPVPTTTTSSTTTPVPTTATTPASTTTTTTTSATSPVPTSTTTPAPTSPTGTTPAPSPSPKPTPASTTQSTADTTETASTTAATTEDSTTPSPSSGRETSSSPNAAGTDAEEQRQDEISRIVQITLAAVLPLVLAGSIVLIMHLIMLCFKKEHRMVYEVIGINVTEHEVSMCFLDAKRGTVLGFHRMPSLFLEDDFVIVDPSNGGGGGGEPGGAGGGGSSSTSQLPDVVGSKTPPPAGGEGGQPTMSVNAGDESSGLLGQDNLYDDDDDGSSGMVAPRKRGNGASNGNGGRPPTPPPARKVANGAKDAKGGGEQNNSGTLILGGQNKAADYGGAGNRTSAAAAGGGATNEAREDPQLHQHYHQQQLQQQRRQRRMHRPPFYDHRLAAQLEAMIAFRYGNAPPLEPHFIVSTVGNDIHHKVHVDAPLDTLSALVKLKGISFDNTRGYGDGAIDGVDVCTRHAALAAACITVFPPILDNRSHLMAAVHIEDDRVLCVVFKVVWEHEKRAKYLIESDTLGLPDGYLFSTSSAVMTSSPAGNGQATTSGTLPQQHQAASSSNLAPNSAINGKSQVNSGNLSGNSNNVSHRTTVNASEISSHPGTTRTTAEPAHARVTAVEAATLNEAEDEGVKYFIQNRFVPLLDILCLDLTRRLEYHTNYAAPTSPTAGNGQQQRVKSGGGLFGGGPNDSGGAESHHSGGPKSSTGGQSNHLASDGGHPSAAHLAGNEIPFALSGNGYRHLIIEDAVASKPILKLWHPQHLLCGGDIIAFGSAVLAAGMQSSLVPPLPSPRTSPTTGNVPHHHHHHHHHGPSSDSHSKDSGDSGPFFSLTLLSPLLPSLTFLLQQLAENQYYEDLVLHGGMGMGEDAPASILPDDVEDDEDDDNEDSPKRPKRASLQRFYPPAVGSAASGMPPSGPRLRRNSSSALSFVPDEPVIPAAISLGNSQPASVYSSKHGSPHTYKPFPRSPAGAGGGGGGPGSTTGARSSIGSMRQQQQQFGGSVGQAVAFTGGRRNEGGSRPGSRTASRSGRRSAATDNIDDNDGSAVDLTSLDDRDAQSQQIMVNTLHDDDDEEHGEGGSGEGEH